MKLIWIPPMYFSTKRSYEMALCATSINQSIKLLQRQYHRRSQAHRRNSQISVQQQNRGNSSVTSKWCQTSEKRFAIVGSKKNGGEKATKKGGHVELQRPSASSGMIVMWENSKPHSQMAKLSPPAFYCKMTTISWNNFHIVPFWILARKPW